MKLKIIAALTVLLLTGCENTPLAMKELFKSPFEHVYCIYIPTFVGGHLLSLCWS